MKKNILLTVVFVFSVLVNAQNAIQEFNFNGTLSNTTNDISFSGIAKFVKDRAGVVNGAICINNTVLEATIANLPLSNSARTISIWVKYNDVTIANYIWGYGALTNAQFCGLLQQSTTTSMSDLNFAGWGQTNDVIVTTTIASDAWCNYVVTYDGLTSRIYKNGELIKSSISPRKLTSAVVFGLGRVGSAVSINADIDDLKIYNVSLSSEEIATLYNNSSILVPNNRSAVASSKAMIKKGIKASSVSKANIVLSTPLETLNSKASEIYSTQGLKVLSGDKNEIDITTLPEGTYLLKVTNLGQESITKKLTSN